MTLHQHFFNRARLIGFGGHTDAGAIRFLRGEVANIMKRVHPLPLDGYKGSWHWTHNSDVATYRDAEQKRKSNPHLKRAKKDKVFREKLLRGWQREIKKLIGVPPTNLNELIIAIDSLPVRRERLIQISKEKSWLLGKEFKLMPMDYKSYGIKVYGFNADFARKHGVTGINMSGKDSTIQPSKRQSYGVHSAGETTWKGGIPVSYIRATHDNYVRSVAWIVNPGTLDYIFHTTHIQLSLPEGFTWQSDDNGLKIVCGPDDYHPLPMDLLANNAVNTMVGYLHTNAETRKRLAAERLAEIAEMEEVYVCLNDSLKAGNCLPGTTSFANRHNMDVRRHYRAIEVLSISNGDITRSRLAIRYAMQRTKRENEQGYAVLAEHYI